MTRVILRLHSTAAEHIVKRTCHMDSTSLTVGLGGESGRGQKLNGTPHLAGPDMTIAHQQRGQGMHLIPVGAVHFAEVSVVLDVISRHAAGG